MRVVSIVKEDNGSRAQAFRCLEGCVRARLHVLAPDNVSYPNGPRNLLDCPPLSRVVRKATNEATRRDVRILRALHTSGLIVTLAPVSLDAVRHALTVAEYQHQ